MSSQGHCRAPGNHWCVVVYQICLTLAFAIRTNVVPLQFHFQAEAEVGRFLLLEHS